MSSESFIPLREQIFASAGPGAIAAEQAPYRYPFPAFPNGWMPVCFADEIAPGDVKSLHLLGRDLIIYRTEGGKAQVADAHCPHLGAHIGYGGEVIGEQIQCPFHNWRYDTEGRCTFALRAKRVPSRARLKVYPTLERNTFIFMWKHDQGALPNYDIEVIPELTSGDYRLVSKKIWQFRGHPQEIMENSVDVTHFEALHHWKAHSLDWDNDGSAYTLRIHVDNDSAGYQSATAENVSDVVTRNIGPSFSFTRFTGELRAVSLNAMAPSRAGQVYNPQAFWAHNDIPDAMAQSWAQGFIDDYADDIPIWENKVFRDKPALSDADGPFARYRKWFAQFYSQE